MFSLPLLKQSIKANWVLWAALTAVMSLLCVQFSAMKMTQGMMFEIYYGMMVVILPGVYVMVTANKLLASQVDRGSMAYVLSTPTRRGTVVATQILYLIGSLLLMFAIPTALHAAVNAGSPIAYAAAHVTHVVTAGDIVLVNLSAFVACALMGGICFMLSGIFNLSKYAIGVGGALVMFFILAGMLAMFGTMGGSSITFLKSFQYLTVTSLFDYKSILLSTTVWLPKLAAAAVGTVATLGIGSAVFCKKDLPL